MSFLNPDSDFMNMLSRCADYIGLNLLCVICCLPVVTAGASLTAKYYVSMKLVRGEEPAVTKAFFEAFRKNFRQSTLVWAILGGILAFFCLDWYLIRKAEAGSMNEIFVTLLGILTIYVLGIVFCVFPMLARFYISTREAIRGAGLLVFAKLPRVLLALGITAITYYVALWYIEWFPALWVFSTGVMLYYNSRMFVKEFEKVEQRENSEENKDTEENV